MADVLRRMGSGALGATAFVAVLAIGVFVRLDAIRVKLVRQPATPVAGVINVPLSDEARRHQLPDPFAVIAIIRNNARTDGEWSVAVDGVEICRSAIPGETRRRLDCARSDGSAAPAQLTVAGPDVDWTLESAELASHHGSSGNRLRAYVLPHGSMAYASPSSALLTIAWLVLLGIWMLPAAPFPRWARRLHATAAVAALALVLAVIVTPWVLPFKPVISIGFWSLLAALVLAPRLTWGADAVARYAGPYVRRAMDDTAWLRRFVAAHERMVSRAAAGAIALALAVLLSSIGVKTAGGSDAFGYVSQAYLWADGSPTAAHPHVPLDGSGIEHPEWFTNTLGYGPGPEPDTNAPTYPPGLPLLMAMFLMIFGDTGPFLVVPASAAALVMATYALGRRFGSPLIGLGAALLVAASPTLLFMGLLPMSDVPAAAIWTLALAAAHGSRARIVTAGLLAAVGIAVRPNLAPLAIPIALLVWQEARPPARRRLAAIALFGACAAPGLILTLCVNHVLRGAPLAFGYGDVASLYSWSYIAANVTNYTEWFVTSEGLALSLLVVAGLAYGIAVPRLRILTLWTAIVAASYAAYLVFADWWFLRFLLPAYPAMFVLALAAARAGLERFRPGIRHALAALGFLCLIVPGAWFAAAFNLSRLQHEEHRYAAIGTYVREALPSNAAFFTMQHSGTVRYYAGRLSVRYDWLEAGDLTRARDVIEAAGYEPFLLIDVPEEAAVRARFSTPGELAFMDGGPDVELRSAPIVRVYRMRARGTPVKKTTAFVDPGRPSIVPPINRQPLAWDRR